MAKQRDQCQEGWHWAPPQDKKTTTWIAWFESAWCARTLRRKTSRAGRGQSNQCLKSLAAWVQNKLLQWRWQPCLFNCSDDVCCFVIYISAKRVPRTILERKNLSGGTKPGILFFLFPTGSSENGSQTKWWTRVSERNTMFQQRLNNCLTGVRNCRTHCMTTFLPLERKPEAEKKFDMFNFVASSWHAEWVVASFTAAAITGPVVDQNFENVCVGRPGTGKQQKRAVALPIDGLVLIHKRSQLLNSVDIIFLDCTI